MLPRRLSALLAAVALVVGPFTLTLATAPAAQADTAHDPATYYAGTEGLSGNALALALNAIIDGNATIPYTSGSTDVWDALKVLDRDPTNPSRIIDAYSGDSLDAANQCGSSCALDGWNREHTWAQSRGSFDTSNGPGTDLFHMRPLRGNTNSSRGNKDYDNGGAANVPGCPVCHATSTTFEPRDSVKGDIARGLFYMDVRYNGDADDGYGLDLKLWDQAGNSGTMIGKLSTLVAWSLADPPDAGEMNRNNLIDSDYQHNRNPFIDHPEWVCSIWGSQIAASICATNNHAPTTSPMTRTIAEDSGLATVPLVASDADGDSLTWTLSAPAAVHGTASVTGGSTLNYTPAANYNGPDTVGVTVSDGKGGTASTTVAFTVTPVNDAPTANPQTTSTPQGTAKAITLTGTDVDGDVLTFAKASDPGHGSVTITSGGQATYTPNPGYTGPDSFTFTVNDGTVTSAPAAVSINVIASTNHAPTATPASATTGEDTAKVITLAGNDVDGDTLTFAKTTNPGHGTVTVAPGGQATYTPTADYHGTDSFTFTVSDGVLTSAPATVDITVTSINDAPTATADSFTTGEDTTQVITLAGHDADGDSLTFAKATNPAHGTVSVTPGGQATYTPAADYNGADSFTFTVNDGTASSAPATVSITVTSVNDAPSATATTVTTDEDTATVLELAGSDVDDDALTFARVTDPSHGTVSISVDGEATYTPAADYHGTDSFTFTVNDGTVSSVAATVSITVASVNDAPTATATSATTDEDTAKVISLTGNDVDGDTVTFAKASDPAHGTVVVAGSTATYTPAPGFFGTDTFTYTASDAALTSAAATVTVTVAHVNHAPQVSAASLRTTVGGSASVTLVASDADGDPVTISSVTTPAHGSVTFSGTTVTYTGASKSDFDAFFVTVSDGHGGTAVAQVGAQVSPLTSTLTISAKKLERGGHGKVRVAVTTIGGVPATGTISIKAGKAKLTATLKNGVATFKIKQLPAGAKLKVKASYAGDARYGAGSAKAKIPLA